MSRKTAITVTDEFYAAVEAYRQQHEIKYWSVALVLLASIGYEQETGDSIPAPSPQHGGWRGNENSIKALLERVDRMTNYGANDPAESDEWRDDNETNS